MARWRGGTGLIRRSDGVVHGAGGYQSRRDRFPAIPLPTSHFPEGGREGWEAPLGLTLAAFAWQIIALSASALFTNQGHAFKRGGMSGNSIKTLADQLWKNRGVSLFSPSQGGGGVRR